MLIPLAIEPDGLTPSLLKLEMWPLDVRAKKR